MLPKIKNQKPKTILPKTKD